MRDRQSIFSIIVAAVLVLILIAALIPSRSSDEKYGSKKAASTKPSIALKKPPTRPALMKHVELPFIASPASYGKSPDAALTRLIENHNALEDRVGHVLLKGHCRWDIDGPGKPRPMKIELDRAKDQADVTCGTDHGTVSGATVNMAADSVVYLDCMYLIGLRKFDPSKFKVARDAAVAEGALVAVSDTEKLTFDIDSGRLTSCEVQTPNGAIVARLSDVLPLGKEGSVSGPTVIELTIPRKVYPFKVLDDFGKATFTLDPADCEIR